QARFSKPEYLQQVQRIKEHILEGDLYELNFCQEFFTEGVACDPLALFHQLNQAAKTPFAAYYKVRNRHLLCASPERFLKKTGDRVVSQPIKGTIQRGSTPATDAAFKAQLQASEKDRAENVMIVDLVRNDLAKTCLPGSVQVDDLFGIYPFETVFQMISTISGRNKPGTSPIEVLRQAFPMGSMTGAPKVKSMELIEALERSQRGLYSGALGYISPEGDFDFNVVIRSLLYNAATEYLAFQVGGAIVYDSIPEQEYEECLLKAKALLQSIHSTIDNKA
ncbi:MAG: anthranilate synthase component I family protein, partial [Phaeodactylibacter sp.]|nr:anthranilate synthase component I family protein [Phaeodactylibacter sp.]